METARAKTTQLHLSVADHRVPAAHLGVSSFGQSGDLDAMHRLHGLDVDTVVGAALDLVD